MTTDLDRLRLTACSDAANWLAQTGDDLTEQSHANGDPDSEAVALVVQMVGQLGQVACDAMKAQRWYAGTALARQVVECHYLLARFRDDPKQRTRWLHASPNRIEKSFRPSQMRQAGGFRVAEYKHHCTFGGHPNPAAWWMLPGHDPRANPIAFVVDLTQHLSETTAVIPALVDDPASLEVLPPSLARWREKDPLSKRLPKIESAADIPPELWP